jgi:hypothetical protein
MSGGSHFSPYISRPGILTAVGVLSIIVASISLLVDFASVMFAIAVSRVAVSTLPVATIGATPPPPRTNQASVEYVAPQGLSANQRQIVIQGLSQVRTLSEARQKQLDGLLADVGREVVEISPQYLTIERVAAYVTDVREMPSGSGGAADDLFILGSGRLQISDNGAVFFPGNSPSGIRSGGGGYTDASGTHLASAQIAAVVQRVQELCNQAMNDAQVTSLESELESPAQTLIAPSPSVAQAVAQVTSAAAMGDGTVAVTTTNASMSFGPAGQSFAGIVAGGGARRWARPRVLVARRDATLLMLDSVLSLAAAGFLLACGIMVLRNSAESRWMLLGYAGGKLALAGLSCYAVHSVAMELGANSPDAESAAMAWTLIVGATGAIYPVVLLIAMNLRSVREFLGAATVGRVF